MINFTDQINNKDSDENLLNIHYLKLYQNPSILINKIIWGEELSSNEKLVLHYHLELWTIKKEQIIKHLTNDQINKLIFKPKQDEFIRMKHNI
jgi:hypothetical protein